MITIFLLCYNEEVLLPHTIDHYKKYLPSCTIVIYDNYSTDNSVKIAREKGCAVVLWNSNNEINDYKYLFIKNNCWKGVKDGWIIMADMDEWLCVTEDDLLDEEKNNTCILRVKGYNMIGESKNVRLSDINLHDIKKSVFFPEESKSLCFYRPAIHNMHYRPGAHKCNPEFYANEYTILSKTKKTIMSEKEYINKHMDYLGLSFIHNKMINRYARSHRMRSQFKLATHYTNNFWEIKNKYYWYLKVANYMTPSVGERSA